MSSGLIMELAKDTVTSALPSSGEQSSHQAVSDVNMRNSSNENKIEPPSSQEKGESSQEKTDTSTDDSNASTNKENVEKTSSSDFKASSEHTVTTQNSSDATPTPAETAERQKKEQQQTSAGQKKGKGSSSSRSGRGRRQGGKKGSWKKLDVEVSFNQDHSSSGHQPRRGGGGHDDRKTQFGSPTELDDAASSAKHTNQGHKNYPNRRRGGGNRYGDTAETSLNWRERKDKPLHAGRKHRSHRSYDMTSYALPTLTEEELAAAKIEAVRQIEYFFTANELCKNTYLRNHMDTEGYLPAALVFNFPSVVMHSVPYDVLVDAVSLSETLEVDRVNETVRLKNDYKQWLYPNAEGGFGCPRWIKQTTESEVGEEVSKDQDKQTIVNSAPHLNTPSACKDISKSNDEEINTTPDLVQCTDSETDNESGSEEHANVIASS